MNKEGDDPPLYFFLLKRIRNTFTKGAASVMKNFQVEKNQKRNPMAEYLFKSFHRFWMNLWCSLGGSSGKKPACQRRRHGFNPGVEKIPWRRAWQPTPVFLRGESHGYRSLAGYIHWVAQSRTQLKQLSIHTVYSGYWSLVRHMVLKIFIVWVTFLLCWYYFLYTKTFLWSPVYLHIVLLPVPLVSYPRNQIQCRVSFALRFFLVVL